MPKNQPLSSATFAHVNFMFLIVSVLGGVPYSGENHSKQIVFFFFVQTPIKQKLLDLFLIRSIFEVPYFMAAVLCFFFLHGTHAKLLLAGGKAQKMTHLRSTPYPTCAYFRTALNCVHLILNFSVDRFVAKLPKHNREVSIRAFTFLFRIFFSLSPLILIVVFATIQLAPVSVASSITFPATAEQTCSATMRTLL